jgi:hypothetical protein
MSVIRTKNLEGKVAMKMKLWGRTLVDTFHTLVCSSDVDVLFES